MNLFETKRSGTGLRPRPPQALMSVFTVANEADLERVLDRYLTVVIDFWAPWCLPCLEFLPVFEGAAARNPDLAFCRVNGNEASKLMSGFGVKQIPTLIVVRDRIMIAEQPGYLPESALDDLLCQVRALDMDALRRDMAAAAQKGSGKP